MVYNSRGSFGDDRLTNRRSFVDRVQSTLVRLSMKQLILLCLAATVVIKVSWKGDQASSPVDYLAEADTNQPTDDVSDPQPAPVAPEISWVEQLERLPELSLPGG